MITGLNARINLNLVANWNPSWERMWTISTRLLISPDNDGQGRRATCDELEGRKGQDEQCPAEVRTAIRS
jgi:hypothetical protein